MKKSLFFTLFAAAALSVFLWLRYCQKPPQPQNYFYVDQVYYRARSMELLNCLAQRPRRDSCDCVNEYGRGGDPKPEEHFPKRNISQEKCCDCLMLVSMPAPGGGGNGGASTPPGSTGVPNCQCPSARVVASAPQADALLFSASTGHSDDNIRKIKKESIKIDNQTFTEFVFPPDMNDTLKVSFRNTHIGHVVIVKGRVENWLSTSK